jgi:endo-1,4-beta-xylanase
MNKIITLISTIALSTCFTLDSCANHPGELSLYEAFADKFMIGTALNTNQVSGRDPEGVKVLKQHFSSIVAENCMKATFLQPRQGVFRFDEADRFVEFGEDNGMWIIGHTLIWHSQLPDWFFVDGDGNDVSRQVLIERMKNHITTVVSRYKGRVHGWDVVNEAVLDDGSLRKSKFLDIIGEDYIRLAFEFAHAADPQAELYYNDYSMANPKKREGVVRLVRGLLSGGARVDAIGMQGHVGLSYPTVEAFGNSIEAFAELGVKVMVTELDITVLPTVSEEEGAEISLNHGYRSELNPYPDTLPEEKANELYDRYADFFNLFMTHSDVISRVTLWGISDKDSWRNNWPVKGRRDYPLLFDRQYNAKPIVEVLVSMAHQK